MALRGRPRVHADNNARQQAYRDRLAAAARERERIERERREQLYRDRAEAIQLVGQLAMQALAAGLPADQPGPVRHRMRDVARWLESGRLRPGNVWND